MKIFFDARYIETTTQSGIGRFSIELGRALAELTPVTFLIHDEAQRACLPKNAKIIKIHAPTSAKEPFTAFILNKFKPDVVFSPMQTMGAFGRKYKLVLTLHDLIYYRHRTPPRQFNWAVRLGWWLYHVTYIPQRLALNSADIVATVSQTSRDDILAAKLTKRPVIVTTNAPQPLRELLDADFSPTDPPANLVYMGSFMEYKNVENLIKSLKFLPEFTLHLLSRIRPERKVELEKYIPQGAQIVFHNGVSDGEYARILTTKSLAVNASLDEGFGIPVADAMALGVPAVITDMPIFHEVAGEGALYFDAQNPQDIAEKVRLAAHPSTYKDLSKKGRTQSQKFSWESSARALLEAITRL